MLLQQILEANERFCARYTPLNLPPHPKKNLAVFTCMDCRLSGVLETAMGLETGEAIFLKNAGNKVLQANNDVIRSLAAAIYELGVKEVIVIGHTQCGMKNIDGFTILQKMAERGITADLTPAEAEEWFGKIADEEENVKEVIFQLQNSVWLPKDLIIHGLLLNIPSFKLKEVVSGY